MSVGLLEYKFKKESSLFLEFGSLLGSSFAILTLNTDHTIASSLPGDITNKKLLSIIG